MFCLTSHSKDILWCRQLWDVAIFNPHLYSSSISVKTIHNLYQVFITTIPEYIMDYGHTKQKSLPCNLLHMSKLTTCTYFRSQNMCLENVSFDIRCPIPRHLDIALYWQIHVRDYTCSVGQHCIFWNQLNNKMATEFLFGY